MKTIGIHNAYLNSRGGGEKVSLALAEQLSKKYSVKIIQQKKTDLDKLGKYFQLDLSKVGVDVVKHNTKALNLFSQLPLVPRSLKNLVIERRQFSAIKKRNYDIFINNTFFSNLPNPAKKGVYMCMFPQKLKKEPTTNPVKIFYRAILSLVYRFLLFGGKKQAVNTYDLITANSEYTQSYIKKYWGLDSEVIYPVCDSMALPSIKKENIILNVGRFHGNKKDSHHKRQDFLVKAFIKSGLHKKGWEFHLAGSVDRDKKTLDYILSLLKKTEGYPVYLHFDYPYKDLKKLFNKARIYWHATGYGSDAKKHPDKQEHFGMSTVEAMSAGSVPIVINTAGQRETVQHKENGYLWNGEKELVRYTEQVIGLRSNEYKKLSKLNKQAAKKFNKKAFNRRVDAILSSIAD